MRKKRSMNKVTGWCYAIVNGRLGELWFEKDGKKPNIFAHAYLKMGEAKDKETRAMIKADTKKYHFSWRKGVYKDLVTGKTFKPRKP